MDRLIAAQTDQKVSYDDLIVMTYGPDNPVLDRSVFKEMGAVTKAVLDNPIYHIMRDILEIKARSVGLVDPSEQAAQFTLSVLQSAERLGIHPTAITTAIRKHRLAALKKGGQWWLNPRDVASYKVSGRKRAGRQSQTG